MNIQGDVLIKCLIPKYSGFCFGVLLVVQAAYENINNRTYILGNIVHNPSVISDLKSKGLRFVHFIEEISEENAKVLIRAHGVPKKTVIELNQRVFEIIDKTCSRVKNAHEIVMDASSRGFDIIVIGTPNHSEIIGIMGWSNTRTVLLHDMDDTKRIIHNIRFFEKGVCLVAQTVHVETAAEINISALKGVENLVISSGALTPKN